MPRVLTKRPMPIWKGVVCMSYFHLTSATQPSVSIWPLKNYLIFSTTFTSHKTMLVIWITVWQMFLRATSQWSQVSPPRWFVTCVSNARFHCTHLTSRRIALKRWCILKPPITDQLSTIWLTGICILLPIKMWWNHLPLLRRLIKIPLCPQCWRPMKRLHSTPPPLLSVNHLPKQSRWKTASCISQSRKSLRKCINTFVILKPFHTSASSITKSHRWS